LNLRLVKNRRPHFACEIATERLRKTSTGEQYRIHTIAEWKLSQTGRAGESFAWVNAYRDAKFYETGGLTDSRQPSAISPQQLFQTFNPFKLFIGRRGR
jgi:hypothetical protein